MTEFKHFFLNFMQRNVQCTWIILIFLIGFVFFFFNLMSLVELNFFKELSLYKLRVLRIFQFKRSPEIVLFIFFNRPLTRNFDIPEFYLGGPSVLSTLIFLILLVPDIYNFINSLLFRKNFF